LEIIQVQLAKEIKKDTTFFRNLSAYSLLPDFESMKPGTQTVTFHFMLFDWNRTLRKMLDDRSIAYEVLKTYSTNSFTQVPKKKVYLADDDLHILFSLNALLEEAGYDVLISHCGTPMLQPNLPSTDIFVLDNLMPDVNGLDVCRHLKTQEQTKHIPVIMMSARSGTSAKALRAGADCFLEKPFQMRDLLKAVAEHTSSEADVNHPAR
jgi:CheY-like chemotaxis protein